MEEQLQALGLGVGARVAEELGRAQHPLRWQELHARLEADLGSRGTLTKSLTRLVKSGLVVKVDETYELMHPDGTTAVLRAGAELGAAVAVARAGAAEERARRLRRARIRDLPPADAG